MIKNISLMILSSLSFAIKAVFVRLAGETHVIWKLAFRNLVLLVILLVSLSPGKWRILLGKTENRKYLILRGLAGTLGVLGYFIGLSKLPLAEASILNRLSPFFVALFASFFLKQRLSKLQLLALVMAFSGAILVVNPGGEFPLWPTVAALSSAIAAGFAYTMIRFIGDGEQAKSIMFYFSGFSLISVIPILIISKAEIVMTDITALLAIGVFAAIGQGLLTLALKDGHAATITSFSYSNVLFAAILGFVFFGEKGSPTLYAGGLIILASLLLLYFRSKYDG